MNSQNRIFSETKCYFDVKKDYCKALKVKDCKNCSFFKTEKQYYEDLEKNAKILSAKGLKPFKYSRFNGKVNIECVGVTEL